MNLKFRRTILDKVYDAGVINHAFQLFLNDPNKFHPDSYSSLNYKADDIEKIKRENPTTELNDVPDPDHLDLALEAMDNSMMTPPPPPSSSPKTGGSSRKYLRRRFKKSKSKSKSKKSKSKSKTKPKLKSKSKTKYRKQNK